jgi:hypothetical protein
MSASAALGASYWTTVVSSPSSSPRRRSSNDRSVVVRNVLSGQIGFQLDDFDEDASSSDFTNGGFSRRRNNVRAEKEAETLLAAASDVLLLADAFSDPVARALLTLCVLCVKNNGASTNNPQSLKTAYNQYFRALIKSEGTTGGKTWREILALNAFASENDMQDERLRETERVQMAFRSDLIALREMLISEERVANMSRSAQRTKKNEFWVRATSGDIEKADEKNKMIYFDSGKFDELMPEERDFVASSSSSSSIISPPKRAYQFEPWFYAAMFKEPVLKKCYETYGGTTFALSSICEFVSAQESSKESSSVMLSHALKNVEDVEKSKALGTPFVDESFEFAPLPRHEQHFETIKRIIQTHASTEDIESGYCPENIVLYGQAGSGKRSLAKRAFMDLIQNQNSSIRVLIVKREELRSVARIAEMCKKRKNTRFLIYFDFQFNLQPFAEFHNHLVNCEWPRNALLLAVGNEPSLVKSGATEAEKSALGVSFPRKVNMSYTPGKELEEFESDVRAIHSRLRRRRTTTNETDAPEIQDGAITAWTEERVALGHPLSIRAAEQCASSLK